MIIIGSRALLDRLEQTEEVKQRLEKADYDMFMTVEEFTEWSEIYKNEIKSLMPKTENKFRAVLMIDGVKKFFEIEVGFEGTSTKFLLDNIDKCTDYTLYGLKYEKIRALNLKYQLLTKKSHLIYPVHFEKNIKDYHLLKYLIGDFEMDETMTTYYEMRSEEAKNRYKQRTPKLNVTTEDFFSSKLNVPHYFVHDDIHKSMAHDNVPMYTKMQPDPNSAWCSKDMFFNMSYDEQVKCVQEEAYTIALERYIVPMYGDDWTNFFECYKNALKRICTTLCSGWFREFSIENYMLAIDQYNPFFVDKLRQDVLSGKIKPIEGKTYEDLPYFLTEKLESSSNNMEIKGSEVEWLIKCERFNNND